MTRPSFDARLERLKNISRGYFPLDFDDRPKHFREHSVDTEATRHVDESIASLKVGYPLVIEGPAWAGKTHALRRHLHPAKKDDAPPSVRKGIYLSVDNCSTPKALALAICGAIAPGKVDATRATAKSACRSALDIVSKYQGIIGIDDFEEILRPDGTIAPGMEGFLDALSHLCRLVLAGRTEGMSKLLDGFPSLSSHLSERVSIDGYRPDDPALANILVELEEAMGLGPASYFKSPDKVLSFAEVVPSGVIGAYKDILRASLKHVIERNGSRLDGNAIAHGTAASVAGLGILRDLIRSPQSKDLSLMGSGIVIRLDDVLVSRHEDMWSVDPQATVRPKDGIWRIPVLMDAHVPVVPEARLKLAATRVFRDEDFRREDRIYHDEASGAFYEITEPEDAVGEIRDAILNEAEGLIGADDEPPAFVGFPWRETTAIGATKRIARNVGNLLPGIIAKHAISDRGRVLTRTTVPQYFVSDLRDGSMANLETNMNSLADLVRSFDFDDLDGVRRFVFVLDRIRKRKGQDPFQLSQSVVEHIPDFLPRDSFHRMIMGILRMIGPKIKEGFGGQIPPEMRRPFEGLYACMLRPNKEQAAWVLNSLLKVDEYRKKLGIECERDYGTGMTLIEMAIIRARLIAEGPDNA